ncbi:hypothetical protein RJT34_01265 [Clitoria ternatea]|uniref:Uncharacterized protein n=1 Tax=Clitoria ternatea TaxID=43366 RepID=A0AAN9Q379_CLITE
MVAISLYRGNLHRVPEAPRRWPMPNQKMSLRDFKSLLARRSKALSRLNPSNPNPNPNPLSNGEGPSTTVKEEEEDRKEAQLVAVISAKETTPQFENHVSEQKPSDAIPTPTENPPHPVTDNVDLLNDKEKRKKEVEDKLQVLNVKKHGLVLVLKQILNAEEELKRCSVQQGVAVRGPSVPLPGDATTDTGSMTMTRNMVPRLGSEGNLLADVDGAEADEFANPAMHSRNMLRTSSMSPSSESPLRRTPSVQQNTVMFIA